MASKYKMQIIDTTKNDKVVEFAPGLAVEINFVDRCVELIAAKGIGIARTTAHVAEDIRQGIEEAIHELKTKVKP